MPMAERLRHPAGSGVTLSAIPTSYSISRTREFYTFFRLEQQ